MGLGAPKESRFREVAMLVTVNGVVYGGLAHTYGKPLWSLIMTVVIGALASILLLGQKSIRDLPLLPQFFTLSQLIVFVCLKIDPTLLRETLMNYYLFLFVFPMALAYGTVISILPAARRGLRRPSKETFYSKLMDIFNIYPSVPYLFLAIAYMLLLAVLDVLFF